jgi:uroporphyrinogen-III decarboxylase
MNFFPGGSDPGFALYLAEYYMRLSRAEPTIENEITALQSIQRTFSPDILFPAMDLDEFASLFAGEGFIDSGSGGDAVDWNNQALESIIRSPTREEMEASHSVQLLDAVGTNKSLHPRYLGAFCPAPFTLVSNIIGLQTASDLLRRNIEFLTALVSRAAAVLVDYVQVIREKAGVIVVLAPNECRISRRAYDAVAMASVQDLVGAVASGGDIVSFLHLCARNNEHIVNSDVIAPLARLGLTGLNVPNILHAAQLAQDLDLVLLGGIDPVDILQREWQAIMQETRVLFEETKGLRFILGMNCRMAKNPAIEPTSALLTNFLELKKLVREFSHFI